MRPSSCLLLSLTAALSMGCGGRSLLPDWASGSTQGAGGSSSGAGGGASSSAGGAAACTLEPAGADVTVPAMPGFHERRPALVPIGGGDTAALVFGLDPTSGSGAVPVANTTIDPWSAWPPVIGPPVSIADGGGTWFAVAPQPGATYSIFGSDVVSGIFAAHVDPAGTVSIPQGTSELGTVLFVVNRDDEHLAGYGWGAEEANSLFLARLRDDGSNDGYQLKSGCSSTPLVGDGISFDTGFLVAMSASPAVLNGGCPAMGQPATKILLTRVPMYQTNPKVPKPVSIFEVPDTPARIRFAPRSAGAWVIWQGASDLAIRAQRLDAGAQPDLPAAALVGSASPGFAAVSYGSGFALAWIASTDAKAPRLAFATFDDAGAKLGAAELPLAPSTITGPLSLLASSDALLVAWSEELAGKKAQIHVARLSGCAAP